MLSAVILGTWATDLAEVIRAVADLAWPVMVGVVVWRLRDHLTGIADRVRSVSFGGAEATLDPAAARAEEAVTRADAELRPLLPSRKEADVREVLDAAARDPLVGLVRVSAETDARLRDLASVNGHPNPRAVATEEVAAWLVEHGVVPASVSGAVSQLQALRNRAVHGDGLGEREEVAVLDTGYRLLTLLAAIPTLSYEVAGTVPIYKDAACTVPHEVGVGVLLWEWNAAREQAQVRAFPTTRPYEAGQRVGWQWSFAKRWGEAWYLDPWNDERAVGYGWTESAEFVGEVLPDREGLEGEA